MANKRSVGVMLRLWVDKYRQDAEEARKVNERIGKSGKKAKGDLDAMAGTFTLLGGAMVAAAGVAIVTTAKFDKSMSEVKAISGATSEEFAKLRQAALDAGASTVFSASQSADAMGELAKAGVVIDDVLGGALTGTLSLAAAGSLELAEAATIAAKTMNTFGLAGRDVGHIADVLASGANKSATSVQELGIGLQQVGLVANQVGFSMEETVGLLAAFADRGLAGSDGATSLKTALLRLAAPLGEAQELLNELGVSLYDANGNMVDAATIAGQLQEGLADLSAAERNAALNTIFGQDAIRAANVLYGLGAEGVREYVDAVNDQGAAARVSAEKLNNLAGDVKLLQSALEGLFITSGDGATGPLRFLTKSATELTTSFNEMPGPLQAAVTGVLGITGVALLGTAAVIKMRSGVATLVANLAATGPAGAVAARGLQRVVSVGGRAIGIIGALALAEAMLNTAFADDEVPVQMDAFAKGLDKWARSGEVAGEAARVLGPNLEVLQQAFADLNASAPGFQRFLEDLPVIGIQRTGTTFAEAAQALTDVDSALAQMVQGGNAAAAAVLFEQLAALGAENGASMEQVRAALPQYQAALEAGGDAAGDQAEEAAAAAEANIAMAGAFGEAANEANGLRVAFDKLNGAVLNWRGAEREAEAAVDDLIEALDESNGSLDVHDEKGRAASAAVDALAIAAIDAAQAKYDETQSVEEANAVYENYIGQLEETLRAAGMADDEIQNLINSIARVPTYKAITFDVRSTGVAPSGEVAYRVRGGWIPLAQGGIVQAASGLMQATTVSSPTVLFGERETEQEAFIPKRGNVSRSMAILSQAAGWYNADVVPRGASSSATPSVVDVRVSFAPGADTPLMRALEDRMRVDVQYGGGSVQNRYGVRGRI